MTRFRLRLSLLFTAAFWLIFDGVALADNCGTPSDCFFTERAAILALIGVATLGALLIFGPGAAAATLFWGWDIAELAIGRDLLTWEEMPRWQAAMGMIDPTPGNVASRGGRRVGREVTEEVAGEGAEQAGRRVDDVVSPARSPDPGSLPQTAIDDIGLSDRGLVPAAGTRVRPPGLPHEWRIVGTRGNGGTRYYDPSNPGNSVRVMQGSPNSPFPNSQAPYVRWQRNGQPLDINGNPLPSANVPEAHIPLDQFRFLPEAHG